MPALLVFEPGTLKPVVLWKVGKMAAHQLLSLSRWDPKCWRPPAALPLLPEVPARPVQGSAP